MSLHSAHRFVACAVIVVIGAAAAVSPAVGQAQSSVPSAGEPDASSGDCAGASSEAGGDDAQTDFGMDTGGRGLYLRGPDYEFRLLGYVQANAALYASSLARTDGQGDFYLRRARLDVLVTLHDDYTLFMEIDGAPSTASPTDSDFGLIEAYVDWRIGHDDLRLRAGKYIVPASAENIRSSRSLETIERYMALGSLFLLPGLDTQFGVMLHGRLGTRDRLAYYVGLFNGNGTATSNLGDDNAAKEVVARLVPAHGNQRSEWEAGCRFDHPNPEHR